MTIVSASEYGRFAYNAYCASASWRSLASGDSLPQWDDLKPEVRKAWERAAAAVRSAVFRPEE